MAANDNERRVTLRGRVFMEGDIKAVTGLHIGGAAGALEIGGVDSPVIRNPLNNQPYIPGSSLRGKMRSLTERLHGSDQNFQVGHTRGKEVWVHTCQAKGEPPQDKVAYKQWQEDYQRKFAACPVCSVFGVTGDEPVSHPTSLVVRDVYLSEASAKVLENLTDFPYTEIKWEATIDRVTSAAVPRQIERVPAGAVFEGFELVYNVYDRAGRDQFPVVLKALQLVEEDYLGGLGSRGGGKVEFQVKAVYARVGKEYAKVAFDLGGVHGVTDELAARIAAWVAQQFADVGD
ncbi:MAG: type III-A CRISPR-associated RAMP protein Csm3 [Chloroflexi bacterium HGW-Chloroflexi-1]|nr:MAG: type III-A CRISPR-associated RAMP protein Csm3 [Chloroflexi bacterium HGW-Chloroflexi-1]